MEIQLHKGSVKINVGNTSVYLDPEEQPDSGIIILPSVNTKFTTNEERLVIEAPGEYEYQGVSVKGIRKADVTSYVVNVNDREVFITESTAVEAIPDDDSYDAVVMQVTDALDEGKIAKISYPLVLSLKGGSLSAETAADAVKSVNLKKITPGEKNVFVLQ